MFHLIGPLRLRVRIMFFSAVETDRQLDSVTLWDRPQDTPEFPGSVETAGRAP